MAIILSLFFDDYGLTSVGMRVFCLFMLLISGIVFFLFLLDEKAKQLPKNIFGIVFFMFMCLIVSSMLVNPYENISASGTPIQKANLKRCTAWKTVNLENIREIMTNCKDNDQEQKFKEGIESLGM